MVYYHKAVVLDEFVCALAARLAVSTAVLATVFAESTES